MGFSNGTILSDSTPEPSCGFQSHPARRSEMFSPAAAVPASAVWGVSLAGRRAPCFYADDTLMVVIDLIYHRPHRKARSTALLGHWRGPLRVPTMGLTKGV